MIDSSNSPRSLKNALARDLDDLKAAIEHVEEVSESTPEDDPHFATLSTRLAIRYAEAALATMREDDTDRLALLSHLSTLYGRFGQFGALSDLDAAITHAEAAFAATPKGVPNYADALDSLCAILLERYYRLGALGDLEAVIAYIEAVLAEIPADDSRHASMLSRLSNCLISRYQRFGAPSDLEAAMGYAEAVTATQGDHFDRPRNLRSLSNCFYHRYRRLGALSDLEAAIKHAEAAAINSNGHPDYSIVLVDLARYLNARYTRLGTLRDLDMAIEHTETALASIPEDDPRRSPVLDGLATHLCDRYERLGALSDIETSIAYTEVALVATPKDHRNRPAIQDGLSDRLKARYIRLGALSDLEASVKNAKEAVAATPGDHPGLVGMLRNLGDCLETRYKRLGALSDLEAAIRHTEAAVAANPNEVTLRSLGARLTVRYQRLGNLDDLEAAIKHTEAALATTSEDKQNRARALNNLSNMLDARYRRLGALKDLEEAIKHIEAALIATPENHPNRLPMLITSCACLWTRYQRLEDLSDLESAISRYTEILAATPEDHPEHPTRLTNLGSFLEIRYQRLGNLSDLDSAIVHTEAAIAATPEEHANRATTLLNLGVLHKFRYQKVKAISDLGAAIQHQEAAMVAAPPDLPIRASVLQNLGDSLMLRYKETSSDEDRKRAFDSYIGAWNCEMAYPIWRVLAAREAVRISPPCQTWQELSSLLEDSVKMMPKISLRSLEREDQQELLSKLYGLSSDAASLALQAGRTAFDALKLLELGRGIIIGFAIDHRSEISDLKATHPDLFDSFDRLRAEINSPLANSPKTSNDPGDQNQGLNFSRRRQVMDDIELVLSNIREIPAYEGFLLPPAPESLMKMAEYGTIVVFNSTSFRSDAIIITTSAIKALELPKMVYAEVKVRIQEMSQKLLSGSLRTYASRNAKMKELLLWLWDVAVEPVFEELKLHGNIDNTNQTRIWWIGVGELSTAPFHAAGDHSPGSTRNTLSRVVSSYIPTIKALSYARQKKLNLASRPNAPSRLLIVTMSKTPGEASLPYVEKEAKAITDILKKGTAETKELKQPNAAEVLEQLQLYDAVHFACHGVSDSRNPSNSNLILLSNSSQPGVSTIDRLTVRGISDTITEKSQLAYLSACSTAENSAAKLADETIHLASAFQLAGFNHVLATMWKSKDAACMEVAKVFYSLLFDGQGGNEGHKKVSAALHEAVRRLREKRLDKPLIWAPFIHTGA